MRTTPRAVALAAGLLLGLTGLVALGSPATANPATPCTPVAEAKYQHTFDGPGGTATIELLNGPLCGEQSLALVSYTAPSAKFATPQYVLDSSVKKFGPAAKGELTVSKLDFKVEVPECFTQVDFVFGDRIIDPLTDDSDRYNDRKVGSDRGEGSRSVPVKGTPKQAWYNGGAGTCAAEPVVEALPDCAGNVQLTLINRSTFSQPFVITADGGFTKSETVKVRQEPVVVTVPAANAKNIVVKSRGNELYRGDWSKPGDCQVPEVGAPEASVASTCDALTFTVKNPENGAALEAVFTPSTGTPQTLALQPGQTKSVAFRASAGLKVTVSGDLDVLKGEVAWEKPGDCDTPQPPAETTAPPAEEETTPPAEQSPSAPVTTAYTSVADGGDDDGSLPLTGSAAASIAGGAFLLLVVGGVLFFLARRRKVDFTA
ncbi:LPXTG cell wall anchor domain-containing protein [Actinoplanes hulinensis]|uniref:LPXTG cell wall anchor domain-containing protein n=1 Tax=Actinoplanes hulinensis TaxID=1144547 RepID=A0ABS7BB14_9ACTN|nr:LPXTG cell wall anchor domain-containing protein [Actinoplanes hulinensis]MBW6437856.1 LPXTG cell wall anchor domain-containing protein [Actinoplanes hulinensis]